MSSPDSWDGVLDDRLMADLGHFWAGRNSAGKVIVGVPGLANVVYLEYLPRALTSRYQLEGPALEAAREQVMAQIRAELAPPKRERREPWWLHNWHYMT